MKTKNSKAELAGNPGVGSSELFGCVRDLCEWFYKSLRPPKRKRLELRFLSYPEADKLICETNGAWTIAPEEDNNRCIGWVYLERLEEYPRFEKQPNKDYGTPAR